MTVNIVVVDDRRDTLAGRTAWLRGIEGCRVVGLDFVEAFEHPWDDVQLAVLDGRDDRRQATTTISEDGRDRVTYDRFLGPRVAERIRRARTSEQTRIVLVSAYARDNDVLSRRCYEAGVDYVYDVHELTDAAAFVAATFDPAPDAAACHIARSAQWQRHGLAGTPRLRQAIEATEASPAGLQLLFDEPASEHPGNGHHLRVLREQLGPLLALPRPATGGPRDRHASKRDISRWLRRAMGLG